MVRRESPRQMATLYRVGSVLRTLVLFWAIFFLKVSRLSIVTPRTLRVSSGVVLVPYRVGPSVGRSFGLSVDVSWVISDLVVG